MNSFSTLQSTLAWWVEVCTSVPKQAYYLGPFKSREEAKLSRGVHVDTLYHQKIGDIVALIKQR